MEIRMFDFPTYSDDKAVIEKKFNELEIKYRNGEVLDEIEMDWLDTANTWLLTTGE